MSRATPQGCQAELRIGVEKGLLEDTFLWMEKLTNERIIEFRLPLLDQGHFETAIV